jgi:2-(1,2-epoxy-1,2-dihydrophenyl)acetyl-CoA isomerase
MTEKLIDTGLVLLDLEDSGVGRLTLNRPEAANGMSVPFLRALYDALMHCHREPRLRALVVAGAGPNFCAGGDIKDFASKGEALPDYLREATSWLQISVSALMRLNAPVVAAVQGFAAGGGGFGLVCASDLVVAAESAKFLPGATRAGMAPDAGVSVTLPRLVGLRRAMELVPTSWPPPWPPGRLSRWPRASGCSGTAWGGRWRAGCRTRRARSPRCPVPRTPGRASPP